jgi:hypothetical protein
VTPDEASRHLAESLNNAFDHNAGILTLKARLNMASIACFVLTIILLALRMIGL